MKRTRKEICALRTLVIFETVGLHKGSQLLFDIDSQTDERQEWKFCSQIFYGRKFTLQFLGQRRSEPILCDTHRLISVSKSVFNNDLIAALAENNADARTIFGMP